MIREEVRSTKGRPRASTPVATRGTACTIRVLRRFLNSVLALTAPSDTISAASSAKLPPESFIPSAAVPQLLRICANAWRRRHGFSLRASGAFRGRLAVCSNQQHPRFFCDPDRPNQQINRSLEKRRMVSFNSMAEKKEHPSADKKSRSQHPFHKKEKDDASKNHGDAKAVQEFIPAVFVLVIVLSHVVRQARHQRTSCQPIPAAMSIGGEQPPWNSNCIRKLGKWL